MSKILLLILIFLTTIFSSFAETPQKLYIRTFHPATNFIITDPYGRKTGFDSTTKTSYNETPNKAYVQDNFSGDEWDSSYLYITNDNNVLDGKYLIKIVGESDSFSLSLNYSSLSTDIQEFTYPKKVDYYEFEYNYEQIKKGIPIKITRIITASTLMDDIRLLEKQHALRDSSYASKLMQNILKIEEYKDISAKQKKYKEFIQEINQQYHKPKKDVYITSIALGMLQRDVEYIINHIQ